MNSRQRVLAALNHERPDRTPRLLYGELIGYVPTIRELLKDKCAPKTPGEFFEMDLARVRTKPSTLGKERFDDWLPEIPGQDASSLPVNEWGVRKRPGSTHHFSHIESPLKHVEDFQRIQDYPWPDLDADYRYEGLAEQVGAIRARGLAVAGTPGSVFETSWAIRGMETTMEDMLTRPKIAHYLFERTGYCQSYAAAKLAEAGVDLIMLGDDVAMQTGMMMSIATWREFLRPTLEATINAAKKARPETKVFYHCDGNLEPLIPDLIEIGVDVLNPVQPDCMDPAKIKRDYGNELAFFGTVSCQQTMPFGSPDDVKEEVQTRIRTVGYDGGLILAPAHVLEPEVPWENIVAFFEAASEPL